MYAQRLAEHGYITVTADAAYQGASGGVPRNVDKPANRIEDIHGMADFISQYPGVDSTRIGLLGICGGGGYSLAAAETDKRFKSIATISMFNSGLRNHNVLIYLCVDVNGEVKDLHRQFNIIYIMRTNINQGRIQSLAVHDCSAH